MPDDIGKYLIIAFALLFGALAWHAWQIKQHSVQWPYVMGEVTHAQVHSPAPGTDEYDTAHHRWHSEVSYRYEVAGVAYKGNRLRAFGKHHFTQEEAEAEIADYRVGAKIKVYYDPAKHSTSVLIPG